MARLGQMARILLAAALVWLLSERPASASEIGPPVQQENVSGPAKLTVTVGKSLIIDSPLNIQRVSVADGDLVEAVAVNPKEVLLNGKGPGETSLIVWQQNGNRLVYDLTVRMSPLKLEAVREQIAREFPDSDINVTFDNDTAFLRGAVKDVIAAERVVAIAATLGKTVNLLRVEVPPAETQILLKVRFADVDRTASSELGVDLASTALNQSTSITTGQFPGLAVNQTGTFSLSNALNIFLFRNDLNLGAAIQALETKGLLETLAEPNVLAINGKPASFLSGGEFPYPMVQGGAAVGTVTIAFREYGIRLNFLPVITPRGTIRLKVAPEVSGLDYSNALSFEGYTIPALTTRKVETEVELESGQSFVIAGLLDKEMTETLSKIPGLSNIPLLGKLFQSRNRTKSNNELMVIVTPEVVRPIQAGQPVPDLNYPGPFMKENSAVPMQQPGIDKTGPVPAQPHLQSIPIEQLAPQPKQEEAAPAANAPAANKEAAPVRQPAPIPAQAPPSGGGSGGNSQ
ncbi:MAG: pilus assembly protein N-terminal domain-containing protein [Bryobacteraceae bacterium]